MDFIKVGSACPKTKVADVLYNVENICYCIDKSYDSNVKFIFKLRKLVKEEK